MKTLNRFLELGVINTLRVDRVTQPGLYLVAEDGKDVLLPNAYIQDEMKEGSLVDVFLYTDSQDRLIATTLTPKAMLNEFAMLEVVDTAPFGAFLDWGLPKDLLVPKKLQKTPFRLGEKRFVKVVYDEKTHRLVGSEKLGNFFDKNVKGLRKYQKVDIVIIAKTPLGYKCIVNDKYEGLVYHNEIFQKIELEKRIDAYIKNIRTDGNIDISLVKIGAKGSKDSTEKIMQLLKKHNGVMPYNYKSDSELIKEVFSMSKKEFKRSLTKLAEENKIDIKENGIYLK